jgi:integrase
MELLGHSTIRLTLDVYSHVIPQLDRQAADRVERILTGGDVSTA